MLKIIKEIKPYERTVGRASLGLEKEPGEFLEIKNTAIELKKQNKTSHWVG